MFFIEYCSQSDSNSVPTSCSNRLKITRKLVDDDNTNISEAELLRPNSFCRRSFSAQLWEVIHEIRFQSITIEFPIQMYWNPFSNAAYGSASVCICIGNSIVMDWNWISYTKSQNPRYKYSAWKSSGVHLYRKFNSNRLQENFVNYFRTMHGKWPPAKAIGSQKLRESDLNLLVHTTASRYSQKSETFDAAPNELQPCPPPIST